MATEPVPPTKVCTKCGVEKPNDFSSYFRDSRNGGFHSICKECWKARARAAYRRDVIEPRLANQEALPSGSKRCRDCRDVLPLSSFFPARDCRSGVRPECRQCMMTKQRRVYMAKTEGRKRIRRVPYCPGDLRRCGTCGVEKPADADHFPARKTVVGLSSRCRDCTRLHSLALSKRADQRARRRAAKLNRQARMRGASGFVSDADISRMRAAQKNRCWWCQIVLTKYHVDHRFPVSSGGEHTLSNLVLSCPTCNLRKQAKMPWEIERPRLL